MQISKARDEKTTGNLPVFVPAVAPACPECGGMAKVTHTQAPIRRHQCQACGHRFKSLERSSPPLA